jgi:hypothetical protein
MRIESAQRMNASSAARRREAPGGDGFTLLPSSGKPSTQATRSTASLAGIEALMMLQEVDDATVRRRRAVKRGHSLLDMLESMKLDLIAGIDNPATLARLRDLAQRERDLADDPEIAGVLDEIELRTAVELAKRGVFRN